MNKVVVVDNALITVWVHPEQKLISHLMKAYCFGPEFREGLTKGTDAMKQYKATKWLSDDRNGGPIPKEDEDWAHSTWLPRTIAVGWKHWAMVMPAKVIGQIKIGRIMKQYAELGLNTRMFSEPDEAIRWLEEQ
jgi:hypothetical protein